MSTNRKGSRELTPEERKACFAMLLMCCKDDKLERGSIVRVSKAFGTSFNSVKCVWSATLSNMEAHLEEQDDLESFFLLTQGSLPLTVFPDKVFCSRVTARGRKKVYDRNELAELTVNVPLNERGTYRNHAAQIGVSRMTSWRLANKEKNGFERVTSTLKPTFTEENKNQRLQYCLNFVDNRCPGRRSETRVAVS